MQEEQGERVVWMDLHNAVADLALQCRQDSGREFRLSEPEVKKFKEDDAKLSEMWEKWMPKKVN